jgi:hypothetical protein
VFSAFRFSAFLGGKKFINLPYELVDISEVLCLFGEPLVRELKVLKRMEIDEARDKLLESRCPCVVTSSAAGKANN